ncbi:MAG: COX15/CtaA family protein [Planctomycetota bacterium]
MSELQAAAVQYAPCASRPAGRSADLLALGFGTTAAMWSTGYFCRLFGDAVHPFILFVLLFWWLLAGGFAAGRYTSRGVRGGTYAGLIAGVLNLLIVGSLISGETPLDIRAGALLWIPGTLLVSMLLGAAGAAVGRAARSAVTDGTGPAAGEPDWSGLFAGVAAATTFVLLAAGGLVTGADEGLAVVDWPNTEGYNMFLYPFARMTGGVYLEHAHRLLGSLVGLTTLVLALHVHMTEPRRALRWLAWTALLLVIVQGVLGGLRVTGRFTLSTRAEDTDPNILLALVHGVFGQLVFGLLVLIAVCRARRWTNAPARIESASARTDRALGFVLVALLVVQLVFGALVRHFTWALTQFRHGLAAEPAELARVGSWALHVHITVAVVLVLLAVATGVRAWGLYERARTVQRLGSTLLILIGVQIALGIAALIVTGGAPQYRRPQPPDVAITTLHQLVGAALLAWAIMLVLWNYRLLQLPPAARRAAVGQVEPPR